MLGPVSGIAQWARMAWASLAADGRGGRVLCGAGGQVVPGGSPVWCRRGRPAPAAAVRSRERAG